MDSCRCNLPPGPGGAALAPRTLSANLGAFRAAVLHLPRTVRPWRRRRRRRRPKRSWTLCCFQASCRVCGALRSSCKSHCTPMPRSRSRARPTHLKWTMQSRTTDWTPCRRVLRWAPSRTMRTWTCGHSAPARATRRAFRRRCLRSSHRRPTCCVQRSHIPSRRSTRRQAAT